MSGQTIPIRITPGTSCVIEGLVYVFVRMVPSPTGNPELLDYRFDDARLDTPKIWTSDELLKLYNRGALHILAPLEPVSGVPEMVSEAEREKALKRLKYMIAFDDRGTSKSDAKLRLLIDQVAGEIGDENPPSPRTLRRDLRTRGEPGNRCLRHAIGGYKYGPQGFRLHPQILSILEEEAEEYWSSLQTTALSVWEAVARRVQALLKELSTVSDLFRVPSRSTVDRYLHSPLICTYERVRRRWGTRVAAKLYCPIKDSATAARLLDKVIIDHTELPMWVLDDESLLPIGRPTLTVAIDVCTRYWLGFHIGWKSASFEAAAACLKKAVAPKDYLKQRFPHVAGEWLAYGKPRTIHVDQGAEFNGTSFEDACAENGISIERAPAYTPEHKGIVERSIGTLKTFLRQFPGTNPARRETAQRLGLDPEEGAFLLLSELEELIYRWVVQIYSLEVHSTIDAQPARAWIEHASKDLVPIVENLEQFRRSFSKLVRSRVLDSSGIELNGLIYRSDDLFDVIQDLYPARRPRKGTPGSVEVKVKYDPEDLGHIFVLNDVRKIYVRIPCIDAEYAVGMSEYQHDFIREYRRRKNTAFSEQYDLLTIKHEVREMMRGLHADRVADRKRLQRAKQSRDHALIASASLNGSSELPADSQEYRADHNDTEMREPIDRQKALRERKQSEKPPSAPEYHRPTTPNTWINKALATRAKKLN